MIRLNCILRILCRYYTVHNNGDNKVKLRDVPAKTCR